MIKDIPEFKVEDVAIAVVREDESIPIEGLNEEVEWSVYIINLKDKALGNVLITSEGYGDIDGEKRRTSTLRHFMETVPAKSFARIESIMENVFGLNNEYWISFYQNGDIYDKKYIFLAESITSDHLINIPLINKKGVMIK